MGEWVLLYYIPIFIGSAFAVAGIATVLYYVVKKKDP